MEQVVPLPTGIESLRPRNLCFCQGQVRRKYVWGDLCKQTSRTTKEISALPIDRRDVFLLRDRSSGSEYHLCKVDGKHIRLHVTWHIPTDVHTYMQSFTRHYSTCEHSSGLCLGIAAVLPMVATPPAWTKESTPTQLKSGCLLGVHERVTWASVSTIFHSVLGLSLGE
jgi:hypothetical protein